MRRFSIQGSPDALSANGLAAAVTLATAATLTANTVATDGLAHKITVGGLAATNHSGKTITVTGTYGGVAITDTMAGPNGVATVTTAKHFSTVTAVSISATAGADTFNIGWALEAVSNWQYIGRLSNPETFTVGFGCQVLSGSPTFSVQHSHGGSSVSDAYTHSVVAAKTANTEGYYTTPINAFRLLWTAAGSVEMTGNWTE